MADKLKVDAIERCIQWVKDDLIRDRPSYESQGRKLVSEAQAELAQLSQAVEAARREDIESVRRNYVEAYECMEQRIEAATVAITQLQVVIESLKIADS